MKTILVATDFSAPAANAVDYAAQLSRTWNARLVLAHGFSIPLAGYDSMAPLNVISELQSASTDALREVKKELHTKYGDDLDVYCVAEAGSSDGIISDLAQKFDANLVVLGMAEGAGMLKKHLIGSTVTDAIHALKIPVMVVPQHSPYKKIDKVIFAVAPDWDDDLTAFMTARNFCEVLGANLEVLSVLALQSTQTESENLRIRIDRQLRDIAHLTTIVRAENVPQGLENYIETHNPDLIMLHPRHHGLLSRLFETGTINHLVYSSQIPILTFHA